MISPQAFAGTPRLPRPQSFEHWRERVVSRLLGRVAPVDFNFAFDTVVKWMDGRHIDAQQARYSAQDIAIAMTGVCPGVFVQRCELTDVCMITMVMKAQDSDEVQHQRTRTIDIRDPQAAPTPVDMTSKKRA